MARQNERKMKLYMEAGLAVLLVLTIALASVSGRLSSQAHEKDKNKQEAAVQGEAEVSERSSFQRWSRVYRSVLQDVL